jgi:hypothetical protein
VGDASLLRADGLVQPAPQYGTYCNDSRSEEQYAIRFGSCACAAAGRSENRKRLAWHGSAIIVRGPRGTLVWVPVDRITVSDDGVADIQPVRARVQ